MPATSPVTAASRFASGLPGSSLAACAQKGSALATFPTRTRARQRSTFASWPSVRPSPLLSRLFGSVPRTSTSSPSLTPSPSVSGEVGLVPVSNLLTNTPVPVSAGSTRPSPSRSGKLTKRSKASCRRVNVTRATAGTPAPSLATTSSTCSAPEVSPEMSTGPGRVDATYDTGPTLRVLRR